VVGTTARLSPGALSFPEVRHVSHQCQGQTAAATFSQVELGDYLLTLDGEIDRLHELQVEQLELLRTLQRSLGALEQGVGSRR
jgi:hypothetical protein